MLIYYHDAGCQFGNLSLQQHLRHSPADLVSIDEVIGSSWQDY
jgi:hypothetical protein